MSMSRSRLDLSQVAQSIPTTSLNFFALAEARLVLVFVPLGHESIARVQVHGFVFRHLRHRIDGALANVHVLFRAVPHATLFLFGVAISARDKLHPDLVAEGNPTTARSRSDPVPEYWTLYDPGK